MNFVLMIQGMIQGKDFLSWISTDFLSMMTSLLRYPVLIILFGLTLWVIVEIGMTSFEWLVRTGRLMRNEDVIKGTEKGIKKRFRRFLSYFSKKEPRDLEEGLREAKMLMENRDNIITTSNCDTGSDVQMLEEKNAIEEGSKEAIAVIKGCTSCKFVHLFLNGLSNLKNDESFPIRLQKLLQTCDEEISKRLEKTRTMVRIGPILGLMGTMIPMGPALLALTQGDINTLATSLIFAFGTTVLGLLVGGVAYVITTVRQHWYDRDINDIRYICEMLLGGG